MQALDLDIEWIRPRLAREKGWDPARIDAALNGYFEFLARVGNSPSSGRESPMPDVDEVWHLHIIDTQNYGPDCVRLFGRFIHHVPRKDTEEKGDCASCQSCSDCGNCIADCSSCFADRE